MDVLYLETELSMESNIEDASFEGFFTRMFNFDPIRLRSSWKRLSRIDRGYTPSMGSKVTIELHSEWDDYTMDISTRGRTVVTDLAKEVLYDISLLIESEEILTENVVRLQRAIDDGSSHTATLTPLTIFDRPLLGARLISGTESEMDLIKQGNEIKVNRRVTHGYQTGHHGGYNIGVEETPDRKADIRKLREAGTYWDNRKTADVVKAIHLLRNITDRSSLINSHMLRGGDNYTKGLMKQLMVWQEILYEHSYFIVHRTSRLLAKSS